MRSGKDTGNDEAMSEPRYGLRRERDGTWTILDLVTGLPAASDGRDLAGLEQDDARDIMTVLNDEHGASRRSPLV